MEQLESRWHLSASVATTTLPSTWQATPIAMPYYFKSSHAKVGSSSGSSAAQAPAFSGSSTAFGLTPTQMRGAYGVGSINFGGVTGDGTGQTIAIVDAYDDPTIASDLHNFDTHFGLADPPSFTKLSQTGTTTLPGTDPSGPYSSTDNGDWEQEEALDVEWTHVMAPKASIILYEASSAGGGLWTAVNTARNNPGVTVVSMSWGGGEFSGETSYDSSYLTTPAGHIGAGGVAGGVTFVASTGDDGAYDSGTTTLAVEYPAISPNVLAVGGTSLTLNGNTWSSETGWGNGTKSGSSGGGGGGISSFESQPSYQKGVVTQSTTRRTIPDISIDANPGTGVPIYDSWDFGASTPWVPGYEGGTSLAAPMWAGLIAVADQGRAVTGLGSLNGLTQALPRIYSLAASNFHDITSGNNGYAAGTGYDLVTGRGSPITNLLVPDLVNTLVVASLNVSPNPVTAGNTLTLTANGVSDPNAGATIKNVAFYRDSNSVTGLQTGTGGDTLVGTATSGSAGSWSVTLSTSTLGAGVYTWYAVATDNAGLLSSPVSAVSRIQAPPPVIGDFTATPNPVSAGTTLTLSASDVTDPNSGAAITSVSFYLESNNTAGLQYNGASPDTFVGAGAFDAGVWTYNAATDDLTPGTYTYYAIATDSLGLTSAPLSSTVQENATIFPAWLDPSSSAAWNSATMTLTVTGVATIIADPGSDEPNIVADGAGALLSIKPATPDVDIHVSGITLTNGAVLDMVTVGDGRSPTNHNDLVVGTPGATSDPTVSVDISSRLDLEDNDMIVHTGSSDSNGAAALASVQGLAAVGRNGTPGHDDGTWTGNELTSSVAGAADTAPGFEQFALVVTSNDSLGNEAWVVGASSETLGANDVIVSYASYTAPAVVSVTPEDSAGNGVAAGSAAKGQRSMETQIAVVFSEPVNLKQGAFSLNLVNNYGSGTNDGSPDTAIPGVLGTPTNPSGDGVTWIIPILADGINSYALKGTHGGISGASLNNGVYDLQLVAADVVAQSGYVPMASNFTSDAWHRLYGDIDNSQRVFNAEYAAFATASNSIYLSDGATNYNEDLDYDGDGRVLNTDYSAFLADFGSVKVYTEPQA